MRCRQGWLVGGSRVAGQAAVQLFWRAERAAHLGRRRPLARCRTADRLLESDGDLDEAEQVLRAAPDGWCQLALTSQTGKGTPARQPRGNDQFVSGRPMAATGPSSGRLRAASRDRWQQAAS
jgi:hypothetical protein